jgi:hypothetical protein
MCAYTGVHMHTCMHVETHALKSQILSLTNNKHKKPIMLTHAFLTVYLNHSLPIVGEGIMDVQTGGRDTYMEFYKGL